ncbi:MAG: rRNA maturation RNase YbeY [Alphaproteobacteria bacterium]|nr:rRNA maturation RNase YbeY [Alphaproteobacteria bacterium]
MSEPPPRRRPRAARRSPVRVIVSVPDSAWLRDLPRAPALCRAATRAALGHLGKAVPKGEIGIVLAGDAFVRTLNRRHRGKDKPTNVLSFPSLDGTTPRPPVNVPILLGDVVLARGTVLREAAAGGKKPSHHLSHLVVHGVLHLFGHDHQGDAEARRMERLERKSLASLGIPDPYADRASV